MGLCTGLRSYRMFSLGLRWWATYCLGLLAPRLVFMSFMIEVVQLVRLCGGSAIGPCLKLAGWLRI